MAMFTACREGPLSRYAVAAGPPINLSVMDLIKVILNMKLWRLIYRQGKFNVSGETRYLKARLQSRQDRWVGIENQKARSDVADVPF
jgi:hypothetical protein